MNKRLLLTWIPALLAMLSADAYALSPPTQLRHIDAQAQSVKQKVLGLNRDLLIAADELRYPRATRVTVFLSVNADESFRLVSIEIAIDDKIVAGRRYSDREVAALVRGGIQRLYAGNLPIGEHELTVAISGQNTNGQDYQQRSSMIFYKRTEPKIVEMMIVKPASKRQPELHLPMMVPDRQARHVKDPYFGEVLFDVYQKRYFSAAIGLLAAQATGSLPQHQRESQWLLGDLYLAYGLHSEAARTFARLINRGAPAEAVARARFSLARSWYQRGDVKRAQDALLRMQDPLPADLKDQQQALLALVLMKRNRPGEAVAVLSQLRGKSERVTYARYNMGVGLIRIGRTKEGVALLGKIARARAKNDEMLALRDKANLALGFAFLGLPDPGKAKSYFREVRLSGPFSNKALLGLGWALSARGKHKQSLVPWMELQKRSGIDIAVQEALLAVPYALAELKAYKQAVQRYENAIVVYNAEIERLGYAIDSLRAGNRLASVALADQADTAGRAAPADPLPDSPESRYLIGLFASNEFSEATRNYRDLQSLARNLDCWSEALTGSDGQGLARSLLAVQKQLAAPPGDAGTATEQQDCGRVNDPRHWKLSSDYEPNLWQTGPGTQSRDLRITPATSPAAAAKNTPQGADKAREAVMTRIAALRARLPRLKAEVVGVATALSQYLQHRAAQDLERQKERLRAYVTQARFGIASVYDRSSRRTGQAQ